MFKRFLASFLLFQIALFGLTIYAPSKVFSILFLCTVYTNIIAQTFVVNYLEAALYFRLKLGL